MWFPRRVARKPSATYIVNSLRRKLASSLGEGQGDPATWLRWLRSPAWRRSVRRRAGPAGARIIPAYPAHTRAWLVSRLPGVQKKSPANGAWTGELGAAGGLGTLPGPNT